MRTVLSRYRYLAASVVAVSIWYGLLLIPEVTRSFLIKTSVQWPGTLICLGVLLLFCAVCRTIFWFFPRKWVAVCTGILAPFFGVFLFIEGLVIYDEHSIKLSDGNEIFQV